jgi:hypothetical protein
MNPLVGRLERNCETPDEGGGDVADDGAIRSAEQDRSDASADVSGE